MGLLLGGKQSVFDREPIQAVDTGRMRMALQILTDGLVVLGGQLIDDILFHGGRIYHNKVDRAS